MLALSLLKHSPKSYIPLQMLLPLPSGRTLKSSSVPFILGPASIPMFLMHFVTLCRKCLKKTGTVVSCLMKCRSQIMSGSIRNLTALRDLRILEVRAGCATLQIMLYFSWSVGCIGSGSRQWLTTSVVEVLRLRCLCNS